MNSYTVRFQEVKQQARKRLPCPACGKQVTRQRTFTQTINPWNRNPDGTPKNYREVYEAVRLEAAAWASAPEYHKPCEATP